MATVYAVAYGFESYTDKGSPIYEGPAHGVSDFAGPVAFVGSVFTADNTSGRVYFHQLGSNEVRFWRLDDNSQHVLGTVGEGSIVGLAATAGVCYAAYLRAFTGSEEVELRLCTFLHDGSVVKDIGILSGPDLYRPGKSQTNAIGIDYDPIGNETWVSVVPRNFDDATVTDQAMRLYRLQSHEVWDVWEVPVAQSPGSGVNNDPRPGLRVVNSHAYVPVYVGASERMELWAYQITPAGPSRTLFEAFANPWPMTPLFHAPHGFSSASEFGGQSMPGFGVTDDERFAFYVIGNSSHDHLYRLSLQEPFVTSVYDTRFSTYRWVDVDGDAGRNRQPRLRQLSRNELSNLGRFSRQRSLHRGPGSLL